MKITRRTAVAAVASVLIGAGFGVPYAIIGTPSAAVVPSSAPSGPADPVGILMKMHVPVPPGVTADQVDIDGARYASGQFASGEQVTVDTYATWQAEQADIARNPSNDVNKLLVGQLFTVTVTGVDGGAGISFPTSVADLARESGAAVR